jgi:hypothetical protein
MAMIRLIGHLAKAGGPLALLLAFTPASFGQASFGQACCNDTCCNRWNCPPPYKHCQEGPPRICIICGCPKPVCCPSEAPNWGYYQTCWRPYAWPPNWSHCYGVPPASQIVPPLASSPALMGSHDEPPGQIQMPRVLPVPSVVPR